MSEKSNNNNEQTTAWYRRPLWNALWWVLAYMIVVSIALVVFYECSDVISSIFATKYYVWTIENFIKVVIGIFALFAFVVTIWRGNLHAQQVSNQMEQLKLGNKQFKNATDNLIETQKSNLARLLVDGTKLLGTETKKAEKIAGVACLGTIIKGKNDLKVQAVNVLDAFIVDFTNDIINKDIYSIIIQSRDNLNRKFFVINSKSCEVYNALLVLAQYCQETYQFFSYENIRVTKISFIAENFVGWIRGITYFQCAFENAYIFGENTIFTRSTFINCSINCNIGQPGENGFAYCVFNTHLDWWVVPKNVKQKFCGCVFDDKKITDDKALKFFEACGIVPLSEKPTKQPAAPFFWLKKNY